MAGLETKDAETQTERLETPEECGQRLADESFAPSYRITASRLKKTIRKALGRRVMLPRERGSMKVRAKIDLTPLQGIRAMAENAGLTAAPFVRRGQIQRRKWETQGPKATAAFASLQGVHPLAWGGAKLKKWEKGSTRQVCRVMTLLAPPLTVVHVRTPEEESTTVSGYLITYHEDGTLTLPPNPEKIWGDAHESTATILKKYAKKQLGDLFEEGRPVSQTFKRNLGPQFADSEDETVYEDSEDEAWRP